MFQGSIPAAKATVAVVRHAERVDGAWDQSWIGTQQWEQYPHDPAITEVGRQQARACSERLLATCASFDVIVSSPYLRCVQTALVLAEALDASIMLDYELGESMAKEVFGDEGPSTTPWRSSKELLSALEVLKESSSCLTRLKLDRTLGVPPQWPESRSQVSMRYAGRFVKYLKRASRSRKHVVLVTHGGMLPACARVLPATSGLELSSVGYCASLIARLWHPGTKNTSGSGILGSELLQVEGDDTTSTAMSRKSRVKSYSLLDDIDDDHQNADLQVETSRWWEAILQGVEHEPDRNAPLSLRRMTQLQSQLDFSVPEMHKLLGSTPPTKTMVRPLKALELLPLDQETHWGRRTSVESVDSYQSFLSPCSATSPFKPTSPCRRKLTRATREPQREATTNLRGAPRDIQKNRSQGGAWALSPGAVPSFLQKRSSVPNFRRLSQDHPTGSGLSGIQAPYPGSGLPASVLDTCRN